jgi:DNA-binding CsgD family transcriptional regulator
MLDDKQIRILKLLAEGYSTVQMAKALKMSKYLYSAELKAIKSILHAKNVPHAVFLAYQQNLIK